MRAGGTPTRSVRVRFLVRPAQRSPGTNRTNLDFAGPLSVVLRHPWAPRTIETRTTPVPAVPRYFNAVIGILREGGFSIALAHHALHILGSRVLGFTQDLFDDASDDLEPEAAARFASEFGATLPYAAEMAVAVTHEGALGGCDDDVEFEFALDFILDGLDRLQSGNGLDA